LFAHGQDDGGDFRTCVQGSQRARKNRFPGERQ